MIIPVADDNGVSLFIKCFNIKKYREFVCITYLKEDEHLSLAVISHFKLNALKKKYITKERKYDENSYNNKKIRKEEKNFIYIMYFYRSYIYFKDNQNKIELELYSIIGENKYSRVSPIEYDEFLKIRGEINV